MGLFKKTNRVRGTAQVVGWSSYSGEGTWQNCRMSLVVQAEGVPPTAVELHSLVRSKKWPYPGQALPVDIDPCRLGCTIGPGANR